MGKPSQLKADRASRNRARRIAIRAGLLSRSDSHLDVDHRNGNPQDNRLSNLRALPRSVNRATRAAWFAV
jgi:hypothetical protein